MRTMRMEREDIENSLKVLSHIVDDDFIITVDEARKIIEIDGETIEALQADAQFYKNLAEEWQDAAERKERLLGMYRAQNIYSAKDASGNVITNLCSLNRSESPNS